MVVKIFNPDGDDSPHLREVWGGNPTNLIELNRVKYPWAIQLYKQLRSQFWQPDKVDLSEDVNQYTQLTAAEKRAYKAMISYLTFLDSLQVCNLPFVQNQITAPEIRLCLGEHNSQEGMHAVGYSAIIEAIIPPDERQEVYYFWKNDSKLLERCNAIANLYQNYVNCPEDISNLFQTLVANYFLEGVYFHSGFNFFYTLGSRSLMLGTVDMIKYIHRDEHSHVNLFRRLIQIAVETYGIDPLKTLITAVGYPTIILETNWYNYIFGNQILGITNKSTEQYIQYLVYDRIKALGLGLETYFAEFQKVKNPYSHLDKIADIHSGETKGNFFESAVTSYTTSDVVKGWEF